jgi:hypothetical protein
VSLIGMVRLAGCDFGLAEIVQVGDRVRHHGTRQWGTIRKVVPQTDGTAELEVELDPPRFTGDLTGVSFWGTYHCDSHEPGKKPSP